MFLFCLSVLTPLSAQKSTGGNGAGNLRKVRTEDLQNINEVYHFNGKPYTGISIDLFSNKTRMQELNWKNGLLHGEKTEYFPGGMHVRARMNFNEGKRHGAFVFYHENGKVRLSGTYYNDLLDSTVNAFYENGNPKYIHHYEKGVQIGESLTYFKNGNLEQKVSLKNQKPHGLMQTYYEAGNIRQEGHYNEGVREGRFILYHLTGDTAEESYYKNGYRDSISRYWDNVFGTLMKEESYKIGKRDGCWTTYNEAGDTLSVFHYRNDVLHGPYRKYFSGVIEKGNPYDDEGGYDPSKSKKEYVRALDEYGSYNEGKLDGEFKSGLYNREAHVEGTYSNGLRVGEWKYFNEKGKMVLHEKYDEYGKLIYQKPKLRK